MLVLLMAVGLRGHVDRRPGRADLPRLARGRLVAAERRPVPAGADRPADRDGDRRQGSWARSTGCTGALTGRDEERHRATWLRSMRAERTSTRRGGVLDQVMIVSVGARAGRVRGLVLRLRRLVTADELTPARRAGGRPRRSSPGPATPRRPRARPATRRRAIENQAVSRLAPLTIMCWRKTPSNVKPKRSRGAPRALVGGVALPLQPAVAEPVEGLAREQVDRLGGRGRALQRRRRTRCGRSRCTRARARCAGS